MISEVFSVARSAEGHSFVRTSGRCGYSRRFARLCSLRRDHPFWDRRTYKKVPDAPAVNRLVAGSNPARGATANRSVPDTWVTFYSGDIGNTFGPKGFFDWFESARLVIEVSEIIVHKADQPN